MRNETTDFSKLLTPYCSESEIEMFQEHLSDSSVSGLVMNKEHPVTLPTSILKQDENDPLLFRFHKEDKALGKSVLHFAGAFYLLDPSSATISDYLKDILPKHFLSMDLCGAPGGKTISLDFRRPDGLYLCNDLSYTRANEIRKNVEKLGLTNVLPLSMDPEKLRLESCFDLLIVDVPCSGSGMIRKDRKMLEDWSMEKVQRLLPLQEGLLEKAYTLLKKDGILSYSTCSLSIEEDENQILDFLSRHPDMELLPLDKKKGMVPGKDNIGLHMIPGIYEGEGIYFCLLRKTVGKSINLTPFESKEKMLVSQKETFSFKKNLYIVDTMWKELVDLPFLAPGLKVKDDSPHPKCEFDHAYSKVVENLPTIELSEKEAISYASGNEVKTDSAIKNGLCVLTYQGFHLGFGKKVDNRIKNYLPKGLRESLEKM